MQLFFEKTITKLVTEYLSFSPTFASLFGVNIPPRFDVYV